MVFEQACQQGRGSLLPQGYKWLLCDGRLEPMCDSAGERFSLAQCNDCHGSMPRQDGGGGNGGDATPCSVE